MRNMPKDYPEWHWVETHRCWKTNHQEITEGYGPAPCLLSTALLREGGTPGGLLIGYNFPRSDHNFETTCRERDRCMLVFKKLGVGFYVCTHFCGSMFWKFEIERGWTYLYLLRSQKRWAAGECWCMTETLGDGFRSPYSVGRWFPWSFRSFENIQEEGWHEWEDSHRVGRGMSWETECQS